MPLPAHLVRELYITLLTLKSEKVDFGSVSLRTGITPNMIKKYLKGLCDLRVNGETLIIDDTTWISLVEHAVHEGVPLCEIARRISWQRFEALTEEALVRHDFKTIRNLRFRSEGRRWEIDVIGLRGGDIICFDCKHWKTHGKASSLLKSAERQANRVAALAQLQKEPKELRVEVGVVKMYPALITLLDFNRYIAAGCFVVPVFRLNNFLNQFYELRDLIKPFKVDRSAPHVF